MSHKSTGYRNVYKRGNTYYYRFQNEAGRWIERRYGANLKDAVLAQARAQQDADAIRGGITTRAKIDAATNQTRDYDETLAEYIDHLKSQKNHPDHINTVKTKCSLVAEALGWKTLGDINAGQLDAMLVLVLKEGKSARTRNDYLVKLKAFAEWCAGRREYLAVNPLRSLHTINTATDPRRPVRALTPKEFTALLEVAPAVRRLSYWLAGGLGLRWSEIRQVRWSSIDFKRGWITLPASISKNRKDATVPVPETVLKALRKIKPSERKNEVCPHPPILRTFKLDIAAAEIPAVTEAGAAHRRSLRKTFITHLAISGVDLRTAQRLARHSRPELTANIYTDPHLLDMTDAMGRIGKVQKAPKSRAKSGNRVTRKKKK